MRHHQPIDRGCRMDSVYMEDGLAEIGQRDDAPIRIPWYCQLYIHEVVWS